MPGEAIFRVGHQIPQFGGIDRDSDPAAIPVHRFRDAINVRLVGRVTCRGGQAKLNPDGGITGCVSGIFSPEYQFPQVSGKVMALPAVGQLGLPGQQASADAGDAFQIDLPDVVRHNLDPDRLLNYTYAATFNGFVLSTQESLRRLAPVALATSPAWQDWRLITSLAQIGTDLFIGGYTGPGESSDSLPFIFKWNGSDASLEDGESFPLVAWGTEVIPDSFGYPAVVSLGVYDESELFASVGDPVNGSSYGLARRDGAGAWTDITGTFPVGVSEFYARGFCTRTTKLYMCGTSYGNTPQNGQILSWDGATLALEHSIAPLDGDTPVIIGAMCLVGTTLYYLWTDRGILKLGTYAGSTWDDTRKDLSSQVTFATVPPLAPPDPQVRENNMPVALWEEDGIMHAAVILGLSDYSAGNLYFLHAGGTTSGTWIVDYGPVDAGVFSWVQQHPQDV